MKQIQASINEDQKMVLLMLADYCSSEAKDLACYYAKRYLINKTQSTDIVEANDQYIDKMVSEEGWRGVEYIIDKLDMLIS